MTKAEAEIADKVGAYHVHLPVPEPGNGNVTTLEFPALPDLQGNLNTAARVAAGVVAMGVGGVVVGPLGVAGTAAAAAVGVVGGAGWWLRDRGLDPIVRKAQDIATDLGIEMPAIPEIPSFPSLPALPSLDGITSSFSSFVSWMQMLALVYVGWKLLK